jgi:hypothetical protein
MGVTSDHFFVPTVNASFPAAMRGQRRFFDGAHTSLVLPCPGEDPARTF